MSFFQESVKKKYVNELNKELLDDKFRQFQSYFNNPEIQENIRKAKEEQFQEGFLRELFVNIFDYTLNPLPNYNLTTELKNIANSKKVDGAILKGDDAVAVIELKGTDTSDLDKVEAQAFGYKSHNPKCNYVIISNFEKLRFYISNAVEHISFNLFRLTREQFAVMWLCLAKDNLLNDIPLKMKESSLMQEENITKKLYADYSKFRNAIFSNLVIKNPEIDKLLLFKKTQKLLDRFLFIFFAEDRLLIPPNSIREIINQWETLRDVLDEYMPLYDRFKKFFNYLNTGYKGKNYEVFAYNGGLFEPDEILDNITIDDNILYEHTLKLTQYDFDTEVDVNILGHIFEHSLSEIENVQAEIKGEKVETQKSKRKKDGIFYTPKYITKYIVENTVGKLCLEKREEIGIIDEEYAKGRKNRKRETILELDKKLTDYRNWLLNISILDPACGSGAFLNQALDFLIYEHQKIDNLRAALFEEGLVFADITNDILENNIYGVDINEESVEIAKLSLWLRTAQVGRKLNSLSKNIKCGNSLIDDPTVAGDKAFNWEKEFPQVFGDGGSEESTNPQNPTPNLKKGFDVVIGNPPYVRQESINKHDKDYLSGNYQVGNGIADLYVYFYEMGMKLLRGNGLLGYITPNKWFKTKYGFNLRKYIIDYKIIEITDFFELRIFQDASTEPQIIFVENIFSENKFNYNPITSTDEFINTEYNSSSIEKIKLNNDSWVLTKSANNSILSKLYKSTQSLYEYTKEGIYRGITTGLNKAFIIDEQTRNKLIKEDPNSKDLIKKYVSGVDIGKWNLNLTEKQYFINTYYDIDVKNYPAIYKHLLQYNAELANRQDKGITHFNLRACSYYDKFETTKILYIHTAVKHNFYYDTDNFYINNSCYFITNADKFLACWLNSSVFNFLKRLIFVAYGDASNKGRAKLDYNKMVNIPIPIISENQKLPFIELADIMLEKNMELKEKENKFLELLKAEFNIHKVSTKLENWSKHTWSDFEFELKKAKITLSREKKEDWFERFNRYKSQTDELKSIIDMTDRKIDQLVYQLYELTEEEIKIVEGEG